MTSKLLTPKCETHECDYYIYYLAYGKPGEPNLEHLAYHSAARQCSIAQGEIMEWMGANPNKDPLQDRRGTTLWRLAETWEKKIRA